jgi:predicted dehydrogenase
MYRIGVFGVGHLGKIHMKCLQLLPEVYEIVGFFDPNDEQAAAAEATYGIPRYSTADELLAAVEVVDIVTPTITHFEMAKRAISAGKHVFIEKPVTETVEQAEDLLKLTQEYGVKVQVGHVERFNPALLSLGDHQLNPMFIEGHRLASFNPRGTDVSVVLDLMIHDLDIILSLVDAEVTALSASGVAVVSKSPDICNARIEFSNGCVANLTASRISIKQMRKLRLFQKDAYISMDLLDKQAQVIRMEDEPGEDSEGGMQFELPTPDGPRFLRVEQPTIEPVNAIKMELETFADSIRKNIAPKVPLKDGYEALRLAEWIMQDLESRQQAFSGQS